MLNKKTWEQLENTSPLEPPSLAVLRLYPKSQFNIFAALDQRTNMRLLLLKSNSNEIQLSKTFLSGRGFTLRFARSAVDIDGSNCLELALTNQAYAEVFDVIANDVLQNIVHSVDDKAAFTCVVDRIVEWQSFLDQIPASGLTDAQQEGLFAELWFLREFLLSEHVPEKAVSSWTGPEAMSKDFQLPGVAFEVKATSAKQHARINISSELQLDESGVGRLLLFCLLLERIMTGGLSLPEMVTWCRSELEPHPSAASLFSKLLLKAGYVDADAIKYSCRFSVRSYHFFNVQKYFPRIIEPDLRNGVGDVRYSILLSACEQYIVNETEARLIIKGTST